MKVTALLDDNIIKELLALTGGKNITDSLKIALKDWIRKEKLKKLAKDIMDQPLEFKPDFDAEINRDLNRQ